MKNKNKFKEVQIEQNKLDDVCKKIADICAEKNKAIVDEYLRKTDDTIEGYNQTKTWAMKKKLCPKNTADPPCAKKDKNGDISYQ